MSLSMYAASVPVFIHQLRALGAILGKAQAHAQSQGLDPTQLTTARLAADMLPFTNQIYIATDTAKGCAARLAGTEIPRYNDTEVSLDELKARIDKTVAFLETFQPDQIDGSEEREVVLQLRAGERRFTGQSYLLSFALPNFYFHITTAYGLLRQAGVPLGKLDFLGANLPR